MALETILTIRVKIIILSKPLISSQKLSHNAFNYIDFNKWKLRLRL